LRFVIHYLYKNVSKFRLNRSSFQVEAMALLIVWVLCLVMAFSPYVLLFVFLMDFFACKQQEKYLYLGGFEGSKTRKNG